jgi:hypothetical protein
MNRVRGRSTTGAAAALLLAALVPAGCSGTAGFEGPDPLVGGPPIQRRTSPAPSLAAGLSPTPSGAAAAPSGQLPPLPTPSTATSQAALAGGVTQPLDSGRDLRIGAPTAFAQEQPLWRGTDPAVAPPGARLVEPQPSGSPPPPAAPPPAAGTPPVMLTSGGASAGTLDQALEQLKARNVTWQLLEMQEKGGWRFRCALPTPGKPDTERNYDATGATPLEAVRRALDQMALEQR